jgi:hypothetical protein
MMDQGINAGREVLPLPLTIRDPGYCPAIMRQHSIKLHADQAPGKLNRPDEQSRPNLFIADGNWQTETIESRPAKRWQNSALFDRTVR